MTVQRIRQICASCADDTRLRILSLLEAGEMTVSAIADTLGKGQPGVSKHLARLRLTGLVRDVREGITVRYGLIPQKDTELGSFIAALLISVKHTDTGKSDRRKARHGIRSTRRNT